jgi:hypothetical protein
MKQRDRGAGNMPLVHDINNLDPNGGVLSRMTCWRPRPGDPDPEYPGEKVFLYSSEVLFMSDAESYDARVRAIRAYNQPILDDSRAWLEQSGLAEKTIKNHVDNIDWMEETGRVSPETVAAISQVMVILLMCLFRAYDH